MKLSVFYFLASFPFLEASPLAGDKNLLPRGPTTRRTATSLPTPRPTAKSSITHASPKPATKSSIIHASPKPTTKSSVIHVSQKPTAKSSVAPVSPKPTVKSSAIHASSKPSKSSGFNAVHPTTGCIPANCKGPACKNKKDSLFAPNELLPRADAPTSPADKTDSGLNKWTSEVYNSNHKILTQGGDVPGPMAPTSMFFPFSGTGSAKFSIVEGLFGCASVIVVSNDGVYLSHHWQHTISDLMVKTIPQWIANTVTGPLQGKGLQQWREGANSEETATKVVVEEVYPKKDWESLKDTVARSSKPFDSSKKPQAAIVLWEGDGNEAFGGTFTASGAKFQEVVKETVPALTGNPRIVKYKNGANPGTDSRANDNYHGKVIVSYNKDTKKYEVWMAGSSLTAPILRSA